MFEVQSRVATEVANALNVALLEPEREALVAKLTENVEAYSLYLRGTELLRSSLVPPIREAASLLERAVALDPDFAQAHAKLSLAHTELFWFYGDRSAQRLRLAKTVADRALELQPGLPEGHEALGVYYYHGFLDYESALRELAAAEKARPNSANVLFFRAFVLRRSGKFEESVATMARAIELDPRSAGYIADAGDTQLYLRQYDAAERLADRALIVSPDEPDAVVVKALAGFGRTGDAAAAVKIFFDAWARAPDRDDRTALALGTGWPFTHHPAIAQAVSDLKWTRDMGEHGAMMTQKAWFFRERGDAARARTHADSAVRLFSARLRERPDEAEYYSGRGVAHAILGHERDAMSDSDRAVSLKPMSKDAIIGGDILWDRVLVLVALGRFEDALPILEQLLSTPSTTYPNRVRLNPNFAPLRANPRFQRLFPG